MIKNFLNTKNMLRLLSFWPAYFVSGISIKSFNDDVTQIVVGLKTRPWNVNYVGTHYGGSLYSMCDPFFMFILLHHLGKDHIVWDKGAEINFLKATPKPVHAVFEISPEEIATIRKMAESGEKVLPTFTVFVVDDEGNQIAQVKKILYVRKKPKKA